MVRIIFLFLFQGNPRERLLKAHFYSMDLSLEEKQEKIEKEYDVNRSRMFKGTIAVSVVYGVIALFFVIMMFFSSKIQAVLGVDLFAFSVTFIAGVLFIITLLVIQILTFDKEKLKEPIDMYQCPDYWELTETPANVLKKFPEEIRPMMSTQCRPAANVYRNALSITTTPDITNEATKSLGGFWANDVNAYLTTEPNHQMGCSLLYPGYMAYKDKKTNPNNDSKMRCQYSAYCKNTAPWSGLCKE
jgi:hypothetical protein